MNSIAAKDLMAKEKWHAVLRSVHGALFCFSLAVFATGACAQDLNIQLLGVVMLFTSNCLYACLEIKEHLLFLFLHGGIALFLLTRPTIGFFSEDRDWFLGTYDATCFALSIMFLSMLFLFLGTLFYTLIRNHNERERVRREKLAPRRVSSSLGLRAVSAVKQLSQTEKWYYIRVACYLCFLVCLCASFAVGFIKLSYMAGLSYENYYLIESSDHVPWALAVLNVMGPYMFCGYLATMPRKRGVVACFVLYIATTVPMLMIGSRSDFVIALLFMAFYFIFRQYFDKDEVWISKKLVVFAVIAGFFGALLMGFLDYFRAGKEGTINFGLFGLFADALYKQGVSFTVLGHGYDVNGMIQSLGIKFYSFGDLITTITQGFIGQTFLGCENLGSTNSSALAMKGHSYAHAMSFFSHPGYLQGEGYGSSYLLELYADFGLSGVASGSFILSICLRALNNQIGRRWFWGLVALQSVSSVIHMARGYAIEWISFVWSTRFLLAMGIIIVVSSLLYFVSSYRHNAKQMDARGESKSSVSEFEEGHGVKDV